MADPFEADLANLAPGIDVDRAEAMFDDTRRHRKRRRRAGGGLLGTALAAVVTVSVLASGGDGRESLTADGPIRFDRPLSGTVIDRSPTAAELVDRCLAADDVDALVFLDSRTSSGSDPGALEAIADLVEAQDPAAVFVSQEHARAETTALVGPGEDVGPSTIYPARFELRLRADESTTFEQALKDTEGVLKVLTGAAEVARIRCLGRSTDSTTAEFTGNATGDALRVSPCGEPYRGRGPACVRPTDVRPAVGRVLEVFTTGVGDEFGYVIEFDPDSPWTWRDLSGREQSDAALIEDPVSVSVVASFGVDLHSSCADRPEIGARVEATPAGPLQREADGSLRGDAWLTLSCVDLDLARALWDAAEVNLYTQRFEGWLDGQGIGPTVEMSAGRVSRGIGFDTASLFDRIDAALASGEQISASFDPVLGYVTRLIIRAGDSTLLDLVSREFNSADREAACPSTPDGPLDLSAEPVPWVLDGELTRWYDPDGCPVRLDVITLSAGDTHCGWERADFLEVGTPIGSTDGERRLYVSDPDGTLDDVPGWADIRSAQIDILGSSDDATGYTSDRGELWTTAGDVAVVIRNEGRGQTFFRVPPMMFVCF